MELRLDEIKGLIIPYKKVCDEVCVEDECISVKFVNEALTQQGKRKIRMNREKLYKGLSSRFGLLGTSLDSRLTPKVLNDEIADYISSHLNELIESVAE